MGRLPWSAQAVLLASCRYLALVYAIGLAIGETMINASQDEWQYAPLWVIDYVIAACLCIGFRVTRRGEYIPVLMSAYALSTGVLYLAFFMHFDPDLPERAPGQGLVVALMGVALGASVVGLIGTTAAWLPQERARHPWFRSPPS